MISRASIAIFLLAGLGAASTHAADAPQPETAQLAIHEGLVVAIGEAEAEGSLQVVSVTLEEASGSATVLLAPATALDEAGFEVAPGDRLKVRVFVAGDGAPLRAHKVFNQTRNTMLRLRTLGDVPLWDEAGRWQGGGGSQGTPGAARHRHGPGGAGAPGPGRGPAR